MHSSFVHSSGLNLERRLAAARIEIAGLVMERVTQTRPWVLFLALGGFLLLAETSRAQDTTQDPASSKDSAKTEPADDPMPAMFPHFESDRFWLTGQANFVFQTHPSFPALYSGPHSLNPNYEKA